MRAGTPLTVDGTLIDVRDLGDYGTTQWSWLLIALSNSQYVVSLAPTTRADLVNKSVDLGSDVRVIGRWGGDQNWQADEIFHRAGLLFARGITALPKAGEPEADVLSFGTLPAIQRDEKIDEAALFAEIDDIAPILELRPYYYLLGKVSRADQWVADAYAGAVDGVQMGPTLHGEPSAYRGDIFHVHGRVITSYLDQQVAEDKPYGVEHVRRILMWNSTLALTRNRA